MNRFETVSPLDYRYYGDNPEFFARLKPYVTEFSYVRYLLRAETALVKMLARWGVCPASVAEEVEAASRLVTPEEVYEEELRVQHNIRALVNCLRKRISPASRPYVHLFATSFDMMDTAYALRYKELFRDVILPDLISLQEQLIEIANSNANQAQIGRTHGQFAVPTTFGYAMALYVNRIGTRIEAIDAAHRNLRGKFSGAVGAYNAISLLPGKDPAVCEAEFLAELGLKPADTPVSTQIVEPEYVTDLAHAVVSCFSVLANLADDIRNLVRSEIGELLQIYGESQVGSSTMPHKMNPKDFENVKSLWKQFMPRMFTIYMDQISEHQRDLTNSASARFVPELFTGFCYAVLRTRDALKKIRPNPERMRGNLDESKQQFIAEPLYIMLALQGVPEAYDAVMQLSRESRRTGTPLVELVKRDPRLAGTLAKLPPEHKEILDDPARYVGDAPRRTIAVCEHWQRASRGLSARLAAEREHVSAGV